jgi:hypothetical protein
MFPADDAPYDAAFIPAGWNATAAERTVYRDVIAPYCRSCHVSFDRGDNDPLAFQSAAQTRALAETIVSRMCGGGPRGMPTAEQTTLYFFDSSARGVMLQWLGYPGACAPSE